MKKIITIILVILFIIAITSATFFLRIESFKKEHLFSYDETVYAVLAAQISKNPTNYHTRGLYVSALKRGRKLPEYFKKPLFKHPPLFPALVAISYKLFDRTYYSAFKVSLLFGVLLIFLGYFLGSTLFDRKTGIYASFLMLIEPISWITSEKIWLETTLAFFIVLSLCFFARAIKKYNPWFMIASGIASGFAVLTKYPGLLATGIIFIYALCFERRLFKKAAFVFSLFIPLLMLMPWFYWNYRVYGAQLFSGNIEITYLLKRVVFFIQKSWLFIVSIALFSAVTIFIKRKFSLFYEQKLLPKLRLLYWVIIFGLFFALIYVIKAHILNALNFRYVPEAGWRIGMFAKEPWYFYLGRIVELSPFYIFSYIGLFLLIFDKERTREYLFLLLGSAIVLTFYILWGNFQCRYLVAATVPLIILSVRVQLYILESINKIQAKKIKNALVIILNLVLLYAVAKTLYIDLVFAVPNNICYF